jgi:hypothetical protein
MNNAPFSVGQTVDFRGVPVRLELLAACSIGNEIAQVVAQDREVAIIADCNLWFAIFAAHDVGVFVKFSDVVYHGLTTHQQLFGGRIEIGHVFTVSLKVPIAVAVVPSLVCGTLDAEDGLRDFVRVYIHVRAFKKWDEYGLDSPSRLGRLHPGILQSGRVSTNKNPAEIAPARLSTNALPRDDRPSL